jgi:hypothetical protein
MPKEAPPEWLKLLIDETMKVVKERGDPYAVGYLAALVHVRDHLTGDCPLGTPN